MISIIICSRNIADYNEICNNIKETIGTEYEIINIDNRENKFTIFSAYNEGIRKSNGDILVFAHEDILFHTQDWGIKLQNHFINNPNIGIAGVIGSHRINKYNGGRPKPWWRKYVSGNIIQGNRNFDKKDYYTWSNTQYTNKEEKLQNSINIVVVDGLLLCAKKELFNEIQFDENTFNGFHCYDIDICMQALNASKNNIIMNDILVEHKSCGNITDGYFKILREWYKKWDSSLPISIY